MLAFSGPHRRTLSKAFLAGRRKLGHGIGRLSQACKASEEVCPAESQRVEPALTLPGHLDRILDVERYTITRHRDAMTRTTVEHGATMAYHFDDVRLWGGYMWTRQGYWQLFGTSPPAGRPKVEMDHATVANTRAGGKYFGHWIGEDLPLHLLAERYATPIHLFDPAAKYSHHTYAHLAGIETNAVLSGRFGRLTVFEDFHQNRDRAERYAQISQRMRDATPSDREPPKGVFIKRGDTGVARRLTNEEQAADYFAQRGFRVLDCSELSAAEVFAAMRDAPVCVSVEGSQLKHALFALAESAAVVVLQPPRRFNSVFKDFSDARGWAYASYVCLPDGDGHSFRIDDLPALGGLVDQALAKT